MENWNPNYNWTYEEFVNVVKRNLEERGKDVVSLDAEHSDIGNMNAMVMWAKQLGYHAEMTPNRETVKVFKN